MDRSRRGTKDGAATPVPAASRLTVRGKKNRRRPGSVWSRMPRPRAVADACGRALRRSLPALAASAGITVIGVGAWAGYRFVTTSPRFAVTSIEITGETHLSADQIRAAIPVKVGDNVFATNLGRIADSLRTAPWIASVDVHRVLPHTIVVEITEHVPVAVVELGELYLVDASGHPFKRAQLETGEGAALPVITGIDRATYEAAPQPTATAITATLAALATWRQDPARPAIGELHLDAQQALTFRTYDSATAIQLGPLGPELAARMHTFDVAWAELSAPERQRASAIHVDARADQVTVALNTPPKD